jgi:hypothetical protein
MAGASLTLGRDNLIRMGVCAASLLLGFTLLVFPEMRRIAGLELDIAKQRVEIERQKLLNPLYRELLAEVQKHPAASLPRTPFKPMVQGDIAGISAIFTERAKEQKLLVRSVTPSPESLAMGGGLLSVKCVLQGELSDFRAFLLDLGTLPPLRHVERIQAEEGAEGRIYRLDLWLALEAKP